MKIFITGGAGFIGSHLVEHFLGNGDTVIALDNFSTGNALNLKASGLEAISGDIRDQKLVGKITGLCICKRMVSLSISAKCIPSVDTKLVLCLLIIS